MAKVSNILRSTTDGYVFFCPGCKNMHQVRVKGTPAWGWNGSLDKPTFSPSILIRSGHHVPGHEGSQCYCTWDDKEEFPDLKCGVCHSYVTDGNIQFLSDCTHELAGQTVPIPDLPGE
jgi:hypothetical protein